MRPQDDSGSRDTPLRGGERGAGVTRTGVTWTGVYGVPEFLF